MRSNLVRPSTCGDNNNNAGEADGGMRCAADIFRVVTSQQRTPDAIRDRRLNVVELSILKKDWEDWVSFNDDELADRAVIKEDGGDNPRGVLIGYHADVSLDQF